MSESWTWRFEDADGRVVVPDGTYTGSFPTQSDAESWLGEEWRALLSGGVDAVHLLESGSTVYGPMSLRPAE
jgi:hypothetical protein